MSIRGCFGVEVRRVSRRSAGGRSRAQLATNFDGSPRFELKREDGGTSFAAP